MADDSFSLHIDTDWKKQAQEEKKRLAEEQAKRSAPPANPAAAAPTTGASAAAPTAGRGSAASARGPREMPPASFATLVQTALTQALFYMGELGSQGPEGINLDMAKHQIDTLAVLEDKTKGNLTADEQRVLDAALYETRMRYVSVASQYL
ncbi:MAG TPA: DUF1844 domain-containing protein [Tepidisphaeraceae bacterium]|jgi:hypothetical protein|nr:DUF1844 domain-containing protein [Tepidisphaeraceae bacterium]